LRQAKLTGLAINVEERAESHIGIGSRTSLLLACIEASTRLYGNSYSARDLQRSCGRGGASGVGVNTYFTGGLVGDAGHRNSNVAEFLPSSAVKVHVPPTPLFRLHWPVEWKVIIFTLAGGVGSSGQSEIEFFRRQTPMTREEAAMSALALHYELPGCILDRDFTGLRECLAWSRMVGLKAREVALQPASASLLKSLGRRQDVAATMSSLGPTVVAITNGEIDVGELFRTSHVGGEWSTVVGSVCESGRELLIDSDCVGGTRH
jgi:beta-ribofuranosylaminobenzene 5'-phosphate synthase